jgi:FkbM family methyltransferase
MSIIYNVSHSLAASSTSFVKMMSGGMWYLLNDSWKSGYRFTADIQYNSQTVPFYFEDLADFELFHEVFLDNAYSGVTIHPKGPIVDLGANIGVSTLWFAMKWPSSRIYSIEPDPENMRRLNQNIAALPAISAHHCAAWSTNGTITFFSNRYRGSSSSVLYKKAESDDVTVESKTLANILDELHRGRVALRFMRSPSLSRIG